MKERGPFFIWNQIFQNVAGIMLKLIINVYNYIFACILASNHRILVFIYITNDKFVDKEGKNWSISKNPKCLRKLFLWPLRWWFQISFVHTGENFIWEKLPKKWLKNQFFVNFEGKNCNNRKNYVSFRKVFFRQFFLDKIFICVDKSNLKIPSKRPQKELS